MRAKKIGHTLTGGLNYRPQFEVLRAVIVLDPIDVVNVLPFRQAAPEDLLHHVPVFRDPRSVILDQDVPAPLQYSLAV